MSLGLRVRVLEHFEKFDFWPIFRIALKFIPFQSGVVFNLFIVILVILNTENTFIRLCYDYFVTLNNLRFRAYF